jgi:hypothetical protein
MNKNTRDLYRGINEFKKGYQPVTNLVKVERGNVLPDPYKIFNRWKNYFCQLLNVHGADGVRQTNAYSRAICARAQCLRGWSCHWEAGKV